MPDRIIRDARRRLGVFSLHDVVLFAYFAALWGLAAFAPPHPDRGTALGRIAVAAATLLAGCLIGRGASSLPAWFRAAIYRFAAVAAVAQSYLMLRWVLPVVRSDDVDAALLAADRSIFGETPAVWLSTFATPGWVEYFSFFYAGYFALCALYVAAVLGCRASDRSTTRFAIGTLLVVCVGQLGYTFVPAYGPFAAMASSFDEPLRGGPLWALVNAIVDGGGARKDVFPSLHTALPTWFSLYAWTEARRDRARQPKRSRGWRWAAIATSLFAAHIVVSTMFLRWHYAVDVFAGLCLAAIAWWASPRLAAFDRERRIALGMGGAWSFGRARPAPPTI